MALFLSCCRDWLLLPAYFFLVPYIPVLSCSHSLRVRDILFIWWGLNISHTHAGVNHHLPSSLPQQIIMALAVRNSEETGQAHQTVPPASKEVRSNRNIVRFCSNKLHRTIFVITLMHLVKKPHKIYQTQFLVRITCFDN